MRTEPFDTFGPKATLAWLAERGSAGPATSAPENAGQGRKAGCGRGCPDCKCAGWNFGATDH